MTMYFQKVAYLDLKDPVLKDVVSKELTENSKSIIDAFYESLFDNKQYASNVLVNHMPQIFISNRVIKYETGIYSLSELRQELDELLKLLRGIGMIGLADLIEEIYINITDIEGGRGKFLGDHDQMAEAKQYDGLEKKTVGLMEELECRMNQIDRIKGRSETEEVLQRIRDFMRHLKNRKSVSIKLGSYVPEDNIIVLYINAIYSVFLPVLRTRSFDEFMECVKIVFIHELTHAIHYFSMGDCLWYTVTRPGNKRLSVIESIASFGEYYWCYLLERKGMAAQGLIGQWQCNKLIYMYATFDYPECPYAAAGVFLHSGFPDLKVYNDVYKESIKNISLHWWNAYEKIKEHDFKKKFLGF